MIDRIADKIKSHLSLKIVSVTIILLAIANRVIQLIFFFNIRSDRVQQMLATQNLLFGHGISTAQPSTGDISEIIYTPLINWPPGYSLLLAPFYSLFQHNYIIAGLTLDILCAITLIFTTRAILRILDIPVFLTNIYTLLTSFFIYSFYFKASSDAISISLFTISVYFTLLLLKKRDYWVKPVIGIIISLFFCGCTKYMFIPVAFVIPLFLLMKGVSDKNENLKKAGIYSFLFLSFSLGILLVYQKIISGSAVYISSSIRGFFPNNLFASFPFLPASFIKPETINLIIHQQPASEIFVYRIFQCIHILVFLLISIWIISMLIRNRFKAISLQDCFFYLAFLISLAITIVLITLSVTVSKEETDGILWTYIEEPRYYGLPNVLVHLGTFVLYRYYRIRSSRFLRLLFYFFILLLLPEFFRGAIFEANRLKNIKKEKYSWQVEYEIQKYAAEIIKKTLQKPIEKIIVTGTSNYINNRVSLYSHIPVLNDVSKINDLTTMNTKKKVLLIIILQDDSLQGFQPFLSMKGKEAAGHLYMFSFYTAYVSPQ